MGLSDGVRLGPYEIIAPLAAGGMGEVYRARDTRLGREVALKLVPHELLHDKATSKRFHQEARTLSSLSHPNIAALFEFDSDQGIEFLVMELIAGVSLRQKLVAGPLAQREFCALAVQMARGLAAAHAVGVVHRDLKPENLMVTPEGHLKILDFGLARFTVAAASAATASCVTDSGSTPGTLQYMAPEQLRGEAPDARFDIYAAGAVLYEMATGHLVFEENGPMLVNAILNREPVPPSLRYSRVSSQLNEIILKALDKEPARRYQSARELAIDLERLVEGSARQSQALPGAVHRRGWKWFFPPLGGLLLLLLGVWLGTGRSPHRASSLGDIQSLAVLPLSNLSGDPQQEYFADGMTDELTSDVAKIGALRVISRTSVMQYKNTRKTVPQIAHELNVDGIIEGSVLRSGDRVRITVQLIDGRIDRHVWSESYERSLSDVLALQGEVSGAIVEQVQGKLTAQQQAKFVQAHAVNPQAYDAYLRGKVHAYRKNRQDTQQATDLFQLAIALDPSFAPAYAWLASCYDTQMTLFDPGDTVAAERALAMVHKALELDPNSADAHLEFGRMLWTPAHHFDHRAAIQELHRAIAINPNLDEARHQLGLIYLHVGLLNQGLAELRKAVELNPTNMLAYYRTGVGLLYQGKYQQALDRFQRVSREVQPSLVVYQNAWSMSYLGREAEAMRETGEFLKTNQDEGGLVGSTRAILFALRGDSNDAEREIRSAAGKRGHFIHFHHTAYNIASSYAILKKPGPALDWLRQAAKDGYPCYPLFERDPHLDNLRQEPGFLSFMEEQKRLWDSNKELAMSASTGT
jgi:serine/threonine protein kinase/Tfp pilus assembly protein PilF